MTLLILALPLFICSCSGGSKDAPKAKGAVEKYAETLSRAPEKAKAAAKAEEGQGKSTENALKELEK